MRQYEVAFIIHPEVEEDGITTLIEKVRGWITSSGGTVDKVDRLGKKRLAYEIRKQRDGHYVLALATMSAGAPIEVERNLRLNEQVLRFMIMRLEDGAAGSAEDAAPADSAVPAEPAA